MESPGPSSSLAPFAANRTPVRLLWAGVIAYMLHVVFALLSNRFFYPDGTEYFVHVLATADYADWLWPRYFADHVLQFPLVEAVRAGVTDVEKLGWIRGASLLLPPLLSLGICALAAPADRKFLVVLPLLSHFAGAVNAEFFLHTANRFLVSLLWAIAFLLLFRRCWRSTVVAVILAVPTLRSYESIAIFGWLMAAMCGWLAWRETQPVRRIVLVLLAFWFVAGAVLGLRFVIRPNDPTSFLTFAFGAVALVDENLYPHLPAIASLTVLAVLALQAFRPQWLAGRRRFFAGLAMIACIGAAVAPAVWPLSLAPETHQQMRSLNVYLPAALLALLWAFHARRWRPSVETWRLAGVLVAALALAQSAWNLQATAHWNRYVDLFRAELRRLPAGLVRFEDTALARMPETHRLSAGLHCDWSVAHMSLLFAPERSIRTIIAHTYDNVYKPFDPRRPEQLPDLSRLGYDYQPYLEALARQGEVTIPDRALPEWLRWLETSFNERIKGRRS